MFDRLILTEDLVDCRGRVLRARGGVISPESIAEAARGARALPVQALAETPLAPDVEVPLSEPAYAHAFGGAGVRDAVRHALRAVSLPEPLVEELLDLRRARPTLHLHAFATAAVAVRMLLCVVGDVRGVRELAAAALLHDVGMRHVPVPLRGRRERLAPDDSARLAAHPLLGAYHLAAVLGAHPAVTAAHVHHWRSGQGYPSLSRPPPRSIEVISVASAFVALTQPRPFRAAAYDARGACDVLVGESVAGLADAGTVRLLVHALRGGRGDPRDVRFGRERPGHGPEVNRYVHVAAPARSPV